MGSATIEYVDIIKADGTTGVMRVVRRYELDRHMRQQLVLIERHVDGDRVVEEGGAFVIAYSGEVVVPVQVRNAQHD